MSAEITRTAIKKENRENSLEIQKYFDSFNKELEENELIEINQIAPEGVDNGDEVNVEVGDEAGTYFVDEDGQFYFQPANTQPETEVPTTTEIILPGIEETATVQNEEAGEELRYVYIVEENEEPLQRDNNDITVYDFEDNEEEGAKGPKQQVQSDTEVEEKPKLAKIKATKSGKVYHCPHCEYTNVKRFLLSRHMKVHSDEKPHKCSVCARGFRTVVSLQNHENTHTGAKPHKCTVCPAGFATTGELVRHMRYRHTKLKPHKCTECDYAAVEMSKLRRHQRCHSGERPYQCPHCTYASPDTFKLKRHLRVHTGERPYTCDLCGAAFTQSNSLKSHKLTHFPENKPYFQCELCPARCGRKADLRGHIKKLHTATEPLECKRCGKKLPDRYSYKLHIRTHGGEKAYKCDVCPYASISQLHLTSHMLIHTNEKPFSCEHCDQTFRQKQLLKRHQNLYHNPEYVPPVPQPKTQECDQCGKRFIRQGNLIRHMALHDPNSNVHELNLALKIGRKQRVKSDGQEGDDDDEEEEEEEEEDEEEGTGDQKQYVIFEMIETEENGKESVRIIDTVAIDSAAPDNIKKELKPQPPVVDTKKDMENCFGFDEEEDEEAVDEDREDEVYMEEIPCQFEDDD